MESMTNRKETSMIILEPNTNQDGIARVLVKVTLKTGTEIYLCNDFNSVREAWKVGKPFSAQTIVSMRPASIIVNPDAVMTVSDLDPDNTYEVEEPMGRCQ